MSVTPDSPFQTERLARADLEACREAIRVGSKTFHAASFLLPGDVREPALALYAFCREADDAIDGAADPAAALSALIERLDQACAGVPQDRAADRALAYVIRRFDIPRAIPAALLEGFAWDAAGRRYADLEELQAYAARVAGTVGVMMSLLMGVRSPRALARAADLGVAMQLSNIARDVGEDAKLGRVYLPLNWMRESGLDPQSWLAAPLFEPRIGTLVDRLVEAAEALYVRAASGVAELPANCRPAIHAARLMYAEIGREVLRRSSDSISQRAVVPVRRKALLIAKALSASALEGGVVADPAAEWPVLPATRFLIDEVVAHDAQRGLRADPLAGESAITREVVWLLGVLERLEQRDRQRA